MTIEWEEAIIEGIEARKMADQGRWKLGDLALEIEAAYGEKRLQEFAQRVGVSYSSMKSYRWVAGAYEKVTRVTNLSWSHHRAVASYPDRLALLKRADKAHMSVDYLKRVAEGKQLTRAMMNTLGLLGWGAKYWYPARFGEFADAIGISQDELDEGMEFAPNNIAPSELGELADSVGMTLEQAKSVMEFAQSQVS